MSHKRGECAAVSWSKSGGGGDINSGEFSPRRLHTLAFRSRLSGGGGGGGGGVARRCGMGWGGEWRLAIQDQQDTIRSDVSQYKIIIFGGIKYKKC